MSVRARTWNECRESRLRTLERRASERGTLCTWTDRRTSSIWPCATPGRSTPRTSRTCATCSRPTPRPCCAASSATASTQIIARIGGAILRLDHTQHLISNHLVTVDGDTGTHRCQLQSQHVRAGVRGRRQLHRRRLLRRSRRAHARRMADRPPADAADLDRGQPERRQTVSLRARTNLRTLDTTTWRAQRPMTPSTTRMVVLRGRPARGDDPTPDLFAARGAADPRAAARPAARAQHRDERRPVDARTARTRREALHDELRDRSAARRLGDRSR